MIKYEHIDIESLPVSFFLINKEGIIKQVNRVGAEMLKRSKISLLHKLFKQIILNKDKEVFMLNCIKVLETGRNSTCEARVMRSDGEIIYLRMEMSIPREPIKTFYMDDATQHIPTNEIVLMATDITYQKKIEDTQAFLLGYSWAITGTDFFKALAEYLGESLNADFVSIDRFHSNHVAETVAVYHDGQFVDNYTYHINDSPCASLSAYPLCFYPNSVQYVFPNNKYLKQIEAESFMGITLWGNKGKPVGLIALANRRPITNNQVFEMALKQVSIRTAAELEYRQMVQSVNRTHAALGKTSQAMIQEKNEIEMMKRICEIIVKDCGYALMWIGMAADDELKSIIPMANAGFEEGYLDTLNLTWAETERGRGPSGTCIRTGEIYICHNMLTDPSFAPWRAEAIKRGYASSIALPLKSSKRTFGAVMVYAKEPNAFTPDEINLLSEMTNNLALGIHGTRIVDRRCKTDCPQFRFYHDL